MWLRKSSVVGDTSRSAVATSDSSTVGGLGRSVEREPERRAGGHRLAGDAGGHEQVVDGEGVLAGVDLRRLGVGEYCLEPDAELADRRRSSFFVDCPIPVMEAMSRRSNSRGPSCSTRSPCGRKSKLTSRAPASSAFCSSS